MIVNLNDRFIPIEHICSIEGRVKTIELTHKNYFSTTFDEDSEPEVTIVAKYLICGVYTLTNKEEIIVEHDSYSRGYESKEAFEEDSNGFKLKDMEMAESKALDLAKKLTEVCFHGRKIVKLNVE